jgi:cytochrome c553
MIRRFHFVIPAFAIVAAFAASQARAGDFVDLRGIAPLVGDANAGKAKATVCSACHGAAGIAPVAMFPNLAGQHAEYLYWQLREFQREARPESPMTSQVANLDDAAMRDLAAYFASLPPPTPGAHAGDVSDAGMRLYRDGDPARGTPPCQGCHGADGRGFAWADKEPAYRTYPALYGQHADYVVQRLKDFRDGKHVSSSSDRVMTPVAQTLDDASIAAVAAWIASQ